MLKTACVAKGKTQIQCVQLRLRATGQGEGQLSKLGDFRGRHSKPRHEISEIMGGQKANIP